MHEATPLLRVEQRAEGMHLILGGAWVIAHAQQLEEEISTLITCNTTTHQIAITTRYLEQLDTAGAWLLIRLYRDLRSHGSHIEMEPLKLSHEAIMQAVSDLQEPCLMRPPPRAAWMVVLERLGKGIVNAGHEGLRLLGFIGQTVIALGRVLREPRRFRMTAFLTHVDRTGVDALPIVGLMGFLMSIVLAYQGVTQMRPFGTEIFTVNLVAVAVLREMGVLLTAILVAGRSGSAFTAQIGTMQVNQEVDALRTLGLDPMETLVLPRLFALIVTLPLLTFFADMMGLFGGGVMAWILLDMSPIQYLGRVQDALTPWTFWVGMIKAPVFAFIIALVGCLRGMQVQGSAESVGKMTTMAVVESIFLVLLADALFSILFSTLHI